MELFDKNIRYLRKQKELSQAELCASIGFKQSTWSNYENGTSKPNFEDLIKIINYFEISASDLLQVDLSKGNLIKKGEVSEIEQKGNLKGNPKRNLNAYLPLTVMHEPVPDYSEKGLIPITDISVAAGTGVYNHDYTENIDFLRLPGSLLKKGASYICVGIKGPSMSPTLQDGGYVIIRLLDKGDWAKMPDERIFVVSDRDGKSYLKRVKNRFKQGFIILKSDNPDQASFPNFNLKANEINTIWYVEWYFTAKMPNIHDQFYSRLQRLEDKVDDLAGNRPKINR